VGGPVHFWTLEDVGLVSGWDPDSDPGLFGSGRSHQLYEMFARLKARGAAVSLGCRVPREARLVVTTLRELTRFRGKLLAERVWRLAQELFPGRSVLLIRGDEPLYVRPPSFVQCEVMPTPSSVTDASTQRWVPLLPQRGMVTRDPKRRGTIETMVIKTMPNNAPSFVSDPGFARLLLDAGVRLRVDTQSPAWPDFSEIDLTLCMRQTGGPPDDELHSQKPPTKLINAWVAGTIPLVGAEQGYLDLAQDGVDSIAVRTPADIIAAVSTLRRSPELVARLEEGVALRGQEYGLERILDLWEELLLMQPRYSPGRVSLEWVKSGLAVPCSVLTPRRIARRVRRASLERTSRSRR
jgi:hypothetical protein